MKNIHLTEEEVQQYVLGELQEDQRTILHLGGCEACRERVAGYQLLFTGLKEQEPAVFGFDLATLVIPKLAEPVPRRNWLTVLIIILSLLGLCLPVIFLVMYYQILAGIFAGLTPLILPLIGTAVFTTLVLVLSDMYRQYRKKITILEMS